MIDFAARSLRIARVYGSDKHQEMQLADAIDELVKEALNSNSALYGRAFIEARSLMSHDAYAMFVEAMDKARAEFANQSCTDCERVKTVLGDVKCKSHQEGKADGQ